MNDITYITNMESIQHESQTMCVTYKYRSHIRKYHHGMTDLKLLAIPKLCLDGSLRECMI